MNRSTLSKSILRQGRVFWLILMLPFFLVARPSLALDLSQVEVKALISRAEAQFNQAVAQDKRDIPAYLKLSGVYLAHDDYAAADSLIKTAMKRARKKTHKLDLWAAAINSKLAQGELRSASRFLNTAEASYQIKRHGQLMMAKAKLLAHRGRFDKAEKILASINAPKNSQQLEKAHRFVSDVEAASKLTKSPIRLTEQLSRIDLAKLLVTEFKLDGYVEKSAGKVKPVNDISLAEQSVVNAVLAMNLRGMKVRSGIFSPKHKVSRIELAMAMEDILAMTQKVSRTRFIGSESPFADLPSSHSGFNAMMNMVSRAYMKADNRGVIAPTSLVSGAEACLILGQIKQTLSQSK